MEDVLCRQSDKARYKCKDPNNIPVRINEPSHDVRNPAFCICENRGTDQLRSNCMLISAFVFATKIVQSLFFFNPKLQVASQVLCLYNSICVGPGWKHQCRFSHGTAKISH